MESATIGLSVVGIMGSIIAAAVLVGNRVGKMEQQLSQIVIHLDRGEARMDAIDKRVDRNCNRITRIEATRS
jgi:hypothetical protein